MSSVKSSKLVSFWQLKNEIITAHTKTRLFVNLQQLIFQVKATQSATFLNSNASTKYSSLNIHFHMDRKQHQL